MIASTPSTAFLTAAGSQTSPLMQLEEAVLAAGQEAVAAELEAVEDADAVPLFQEHRDERRADVTGSSGDEDSHGGTHPWWLDSRRAWYVADRGRQKCQSIRAAGKR